MKTNMILGGYTQRMALVLGVLLFALPVVRADEVEALFDGTHTEIWESGRDAKRLNREFFRNEIGAITNPPALDWRFISKGVAFNDLFIRHPIQRDFTSIRIQVRNTGAAFALGAKVREASGAEWTTPKIRMSASNDWQWVELARRDWHPASWSHDADGRLDFPLDYFALIAFEIKTGVEYRLQVGRIEIVRPDAPRLTIQSWEFPKKLQAGQSVRCSLSFALDRAGLDDDAHLVFRKDNDELLRLPLALPTPPTKLAANQIVSLENLELAVPLFTRGGEVTVVPEIGGSRLATDSKTIVTTIKQRQPGKTVAEVENYHGTPTLFINGHPHNGMVWATYRPTTKVFQDFTQAGVTLFTFCGTPTESGYNLSKTVWVAPDQFDYSEFDHRVMMLLEANPNAYFMPRLYLHAPKWWTERHPDDVVLVDPGDGQLRPFIHSGRPAPSWASTAWRDDTVAGLRRLIAHIEASPYADRVIGYHLASGTTEEWMMWGGNENEWVDYSPVNVARFRQWLHEKYRHVKTLRQAWHNDTVTFDDAAIPSKSRRQQTNCGALRDPAREQDVIDYYLYNADLVADTIDHFAKAVKGMTRHRKIVGVFYGYLLQLCGEQRQQNAGHLALARLLDSPNVDFLASPTSYAFRQLGGEGTAHFMSLFGSVKLHGKLWFNENDVRTSLSGGHIGEWGRPANVDGDILQQDKELALALVNGSAQWWFDVGGNKYDDPRLMQRIGELVKTATAVQACDRSSVDEVAMVVDEKSLCNLRVADPLGRGLLLGQLPALQRIGAPVGHYLVTDLPQLKHHKVFFFMNNFAPTAADRRAVENLKRDGHVLVFFGTPGLYRDGRLDESAMREFTGINLRLSQEPAAVRVTCPSGHALTQGLEDGGYGMKQKTSPVCYADDSEATVLGTLADGRAGLVMKQHKSWTAIYSAAPLMPTPLLRHIAELGQVHFYTAPGDVVWATHDLVGVSVFHAGPRTINLPQPGKVTDLYSGAELGDQVSSFQTDFAEHATRVFRLR